MKKMMLSSFGLIDRVGRSINVENREIILKFHFIPKYERLILGDLSKDLDGK